MVFAPWVDDWVEHVGSFISLAGTVYEESTVWPVWQETADDEGDLPEDDEIIIYIEDEDDEDDEDEEWQAQVDFEFEMWVRGIGPYNELLDEDEDGDAWAWEVWWNTYFPPRREPWLYVRVQWGEAAL